jgi:hypothetical protein
VAQVMPTGDVIPMAAKGGTFSATSASWITLWKKETACGKSAKEFMGKNRLFGQTAVIGQSPLTGFGLPGARRSRLRAAQSNRYR